MTQTMQRSHGLSGKGHGARWKLVTINSDASRSEDLITCSRMLHIGDEDITPLDVQDAHPNTTQGLLELRCDN